MPDIYLAVGSLYTLFTALKGEYKWFMILDLKEAFSATSPDTDS